MEIVVSVVCNAYNHVKYIAEALEGFVTQRTDFAFEVLVHDDASTDGTADVIREYEKRYPDIIKPIYQTVNQYSQGVNISQTFQYNRVQGKYIAFCEGDDYWTDTDKLQKQVNALERMPECDICAHAASATRDGGIVRVIAPAEKDCILSVEDVIRGGGGYVATNSLMYRAALHHNPPPFRQLLKLDYTMQIYGALRGGMIYLADNMSVYRLMTEGSWSRRMEKAPARRVKHLEKVKDMLLQLDTDTAHKYHDVIREHWLSTEYSIRSMQGAYWKIIRDSEMMKSLPLKRKVITLVKAIQSTFSSIFRRKSGEKEE